MVLGECLWGLTEVSVTTLVQVFGRCRGAADRDRPRPTLITYALVAPRPHVHLRKLPTPPCSSLNSGVIRMSRVMKTHYRAFLSNHAT